MSAFSRSAWSRARVLAGLGLVFVVSGGSTLLFAWQSQGGFVKIPDDQLGRQETLPAAPLVMTAYAFVWVAIFAYVFLTWRRIGRLERDLAQLNRSQRDRPGAAGARG